MYATKICTHNKLYSKKGATSPLNIDFILTAIFLSLYKYPDKKKKPVRNIGSYKCFKKGEANLERQIITKRNSIPINWSIHSILFWGTISCAILSS